jgi:predicted nucleotidyltransferase
MSALRELVESRRAEITEVIGRHKGRTVALFGSVARGDEDPGSDIDFLVEFEPGSTLFDLLHISEELERLLRVRVDVVSVTGLKDHDGSAALQWHARLLLNAAVDL